MAIVGYELILLQYVSAFVDGFATHEQMKRVHKITRGYSFMEHGGVWTDAVFITPWLIYLVGKYDFIYTSATSILVLTASFVVWTALAFLAYAPEGLIMPEAHAHNGYITAAGYFHIVYAGLSSWIMAMMYLGMMTNKLAGRYDIAITSSILSLLAFFGVVKFSKHWEMTKAVRIQIIAEIAVIWITTVLWLWNN
ncbi:hypothetical protein MNBD_CPR01-145 [hydrothermal vent metagenome]|uniref:Uncharacterized protein n=1 Tax=hydrothermal vent metagenome TaxID=652676 RepID=A0A3B0UZJ0_9ZZZZ